MNERKKIICPKCKEPRGLFKVFLTVKKEESSKEYTNVKTLVCNSCEHMITFTTSE